MNLTLFCSHEATLVKQNGLSLNLALLPLVALGFWNDGSGRREVLDWQIAGSEEHTEWETLLTRLWQRACGLRRACRWWCVMGAVG